MTSAKHYANMWQLCRVGLLTVVTCALAQSPSSSTAPNCGVTADNANCTQLGYLCCSSAGYCGSDTAHCGSGCQVQYGNCTDTTSNASNMTASNSDVNRCGKDPSTQKDFGTCPITSYCCSPFGYCGQGDEFCVGCQKGKGYCPKQCDENSKFCGPGSIATLVLSLFSLVVAVIAAAKAFWPAPVIARLNINPLHKQTLSSQAVV